MVDSGCDTSLKHSICNQFLVNTRPSDLKIYGFAGDTSVNGDLFGTAHVHVISKQRLDDSGTALIYDCNTVKNINSDLLSLTHWYKDLGYDIHLTHTGFTGMTKSDDSGHIIHRVPFDFDSTRDAWLMDYVISRDPTTAKRAARELQSQLQKRTYSVQLCESC